MTRDIAANASGQGAPRSMNILDVSIYRGLNIHSAQPLIRVQLDLGPLEQWPTNRIPGFADALQKMLPGLYGHGCSYGTDGGFIKRMAEGTWLGHVAEHVALELQSMAGAPVTRGKTRSVEGRPGVYNVMYAYETEQVGLWAGRYAFEIVNALLPEDLAGVTGLEHLGGPDAKGFTSVEDAVRHLKDIARHERFGPTTQAVAEAAQRRGIPVLRLDGQSLVQLGWGRLQRRIRASITDATSHIAVETASDKALTKELLASAGVPVPEGRVVRDAEEALAAALDIGFPVVVKPLDGNQGRGVSTGIATPEDIRIAFDRAHQHCGSIVVERYYTGRDYRVLVVNGRVVAVAERVPAHVVGDGRHTVAELIDLLNADPRRGEGHEDVLSKVVVDRHVESILARAGLSLADVPAAGQRVWLRDTANLSTGGTAIDRTDDIHPANAILMERAAQAVGLDVAGMDLVTEDISRPVAEWGGGVVEVNAAPGFRMHIAPTEGRPRPVAEAVVGMMFPDGARGRIPVAAVTGTNGKSTVTRMVAHILRQGCKRVGFTSTSGIHIDDEVTWEGDASGPHSARRLLSDPTIDCAVLETARGGILREGLGIDACDVGAVLNISADHLGLSSVHTLEDLAAVKSLVAQAVGKDGVSVLNADDPLTLAMAGRAGGRVCFFSMRGGSAMTPQLRAHIDGRGMACVLEDWGDSQIVLHDGGRRLPVIDARHIPAAHGGIADFNIQNALAAAAVAYGLNVDPRTIRAGLSTFASSFEQNPGRLNVYDGHGFRVIMDYAHNPAALAALLRLVGRMQPGYRSVIGTVSTPGDRRDEDIREMGRLAATGFDFLVFRERPDARGRPEGEVVRLLKEGARAAGFPAENIACVLPEEEAIDICLQRAAPGDLVVLMPTEIKACWGRVLSFAPRPAALSFGLRDAPAPALNA
jgi:cyanophycin synthetase